MTYRYHHVHVLCSNLEQMTQFFSEVLDATLVEKRKFGTADGATLDLHGTRINLRVAREDEDIQEDSSRPRYGVDHIGLEVEDLDSAYQDLQNRGFHFFITPQEVGDAKIAFFKGPDNMTVELLQRLGS